MSAQTGIINGTDLLVFTAGTVIGGSRSCSIAFSMETREATTKESSGWSESLEGIRSWSVDCDGLYSQDITKGAEELFDLYNNRSKVTLTFATTNSGDTLYRGSAYLTELNIEAAVEDSVTWSGSFKGTGQVTKATLT